MFNPQELAAWLSIGKDVVMAASAVTGASVAILGLKTWRRQLRGHTEYDLARRYLRAALRVRDAIRLVRRIYMSAGEISAALREAGIEADQSKVQQATYSRATYTARWNRLNEARSDLRVEATEAEVLWGPQAQDLLIPLDEAIGELDGALNLYLYKLDGPAPYNPASSPDEETRERVNAVIYERSNDPAKDEFTGKVNAVIKAIESFVSPRLRL